ncbi:insecticidal delta-endotoxin Cry8Ea1 family protein [Bacillus cereus]|nr:insecticidal delta-endotoxin Cry8Ea1 family protein [Bacillus cereus]MCU5506961.1 insecticidal delta-endotoxin Cry8Ea1 family protein [Bacillus cereus]MCU5701503.1 insecticidal delta-endotoxin Cry8Ea1 family protein [Bacillus cereus]
MNSNNNKESNIKGKLSEQSLLAKSVKYPLANNQTIALENMNYKDYLKMSEEHNNNYLRNVEAVVETKDSIILGMNIVGNILSALGVPFVGPIVGFYTKILNLLWPSSGKNPWEILMEHVEELVDQKISEYAKNKALAELEGLGKNFELYKISLEEWENNPNVSRATRDVRTRFEILDALFTQYMPSFKVINCEVPQLTVYAQAATLHLLLLKDVSIFGEEWGLSTTTINNYYKRQMNLTAEYSDHCVKWYDIGLDELKGSDAKSWLNYHRFRREMTLMVLDLVALYPSFDVRTYPIETTAQLTREVYTDPIGYNPSEDSSKIGIAWTKLFFHDFDQIEKAVIRPPHAFEILNSVEIRTVKQPLVFNEKAYINYWCGHSLEYTYANYSEIHNKDYGFQNFTEKNMYSLKNNDVYKIISSAGCLANGYGSVYGLPEATFYGAVRNNLEPTSLSYSKTHTILPSKIQNYDTVEELPQKTTEQPENKSYNHRLSHITVYPFGSNGHGGVLPVFAWTHRSVDLNNFIDSKKITQIPAVKSIESAINDSSISIEKCSGYTGGDVVVCNNIKSVLRVAYLFATAAENEVSQKYRVRVRYASELAGELLLSVRESNSDWKEQRALAKVIQTKELEENLTYKNFQYADFEAYNIFDGLVAPLVPNFLIEITALNMKGSGKKIYIDKIEFIPVFE